ncbi:MAG: hypothetical protein ACW980_25180 [Promethearchaeota archaeon]
MPPPNPAPRGEGATHSLCISGIIVPEIQHAGFDKSNPYGHENA